MIDMKIDFAFIGWSLLFMAALLLIPTSIWYMSALLSEMMCTFTVFCSIPTSFYVAFVILGISVTFYLGANTCA